MATSLVAGTACSKNKADAPGTASAAPRSRARPTPVATGEAGKKAARTTTPPPGVDLTKLDDFERKVFFRVLNKEASACGKAHSLIAPSAPTRAAASRSTRAATWPGWWTAGLPTRKSRNQSRNASARERQRINLGDAPFKGTAAAPVTVVEFVDYECPHCKRVQPVLRQVLEEYKDEVKVAFKHYPLGSHTNARLAAEASIAAHKQGKFWAFNDKVWAMSESLTPAGLEQAAKDVGLDVAKWRTDLESDAVRAWVDRDRGEGQTLGIDHTPTIYVNGREFTDPREVDSLRDWINEELNR